MTDNVFEQIAKRYDNEERTKLAEIIVQAVSPKLNDSQSKSLLDYGSGTGLVSLNVADLVDSVLLVDSAAEMLTVAQGKIKRAGITNAEVLHSDFTEGTPDIKVDIILMSLVMLHIPDTDQILQELYTILNDDGKLIIVDFDKNEGISHPKVHNGYVHEELKEKLAKVGYKSTKVNTFHHGKNIFMKQDASMFISSSVK